MISLCFIESTRILVGLDCGDQHKTEGVAQSCVGEDFAIEPQQKMAQ